MGMDNIFQERLNQLKALKQKQDEQDSFFSKATFSSDQERAITETLEGGNIYLTGKAGTGKTFTLQAIIHKLSKQNKNVAVLATTGIAAMNTSGVTMHSFFALPIVKDGWITDQHTRFVNSNTRAVWESTDVVIIDEISMCRADQMDAIELTLMKNNCTSLLGKQLIVCGDLAQLPPILENEDDYVKYGYESPFFYSSRIWKLLKTREIVLNQIHRQSDPQFIENLNIIREKKENRCTSYFDQFVADEKRGMIICPYRKTAEAHNRKALMEVKGKRYTFLPKIEGDISLSHTNLPEMLTIKDGCRVMCLVNEGRFVNGLIGTIRVIDDKVDVTLMFQTDDGNTYPFEKSRFERYTYEVNEQTNRLTKKCVGVITAYALTLGYAITIHKSQGLSFDEITIDLTRECFADGQLYTALSRVRSPQGLTLLC